MCCQCHWLERSNLRYNYVLHQYFQLCRILNIRDSVYYFGISSVRRWLFLPHLHICHLQLIQSCCTIALNSNCYYSCSLFWLVYQQKLVLRFFGIRCMYKRFMIWSQDITELRRKFCTLLLILRNVVHLKIVFRSFIISEWSPTSRIRWGSKEACWFKDY